MLINLVIDLLEVQNQRGISQEGMNELISVFCRFQLLSNSITKKITEQKMEDSVKCDNCDSPSKTFTGNILHDILENEFIATHQKRDTIAKNNLDLIERKKNYLGKNNLGEECYIEFNSPKELLQKLLQDSTVEKSFHGHTEEVQKNENEGKYFGDFFTSRKFSEIQNTLSPEERERCINNIPLILDIYR